MDNKEQQQQRQQLQEPLLQSPSSSSLPSSTPSSLSILSNLAEDEKEGGGGSSSSGRRLDEEDVYGTDGGSNIVAGNMNTTATSSYYFEILLFFSCGVGTSICYIATLSSLVYYMIHYGKNLYVYLNLAVYIPLLPISILQMIYDQYYDRMYRSYNTYFFRGMIGFILSIVGTIGVATTTTHVTTSTDTTTTNISPKVTELLISAFLQGTGGAILLGTLNQMASFVMETKSLLVIQQSLSPPPSNEGLFVSSSSNAGVSGRRLKAALSAGVQASALIVLLISILTGFIATTAKSHHTDANIDSNDTDNDHDVNDKQQHREYRTFFYSIVGLECVLCVVFIILMYYHPPVVISMKRRDLSILQQRQRQRQQVIGGDGGDSGGGGGGGEGRIDTGDDAGAGDRMMTLGVEESKQLDQSESFDDEEDPLRVPLLSQEERPQEQERQPPPPPQQQQELSFVELWNISKSCCIILFITLLPSFLVGTWFTHVHTQWMVLPQILFYVRIGSDFVGRIATLYVTPKSVSCLTYTSLFRLLPVVFFFLNASTTSKSLLLSLLFPHHHSSRSITGDEEGIPDHDAIHTISDYISIGLVAWIAFLSGYLVTGCFQLAPGLLQMVDSSSSSLSSLPERGRRRSPLASSLSEFSSPSLSSVGGGEDEFKDEFVSEEGGEANEEADARIISNETNVVGNSTNNDANVAKQASLLNLAFSIAALLGLASSFALIGLGL